MRKAFSVVISLLILVIAGAAQSSLPGWTVSINGNFLNISNAATNNGFASVEAVRVAQNWELRADQLTTAAPAGGSIQLFRPEYRRQLSDWIKPNQFVNTANFEPFFNVGGGFANSNSGTASANRPAWVVGAGFDYAAGGTGMFTLRPLDISYVRASILQGGGQIIGNHLQLMSGIGIRIGSAAQISTNKAARAAVKAQYRLE
jgi:hypothetical protein